MNATIVAIAVIYLLICSAIGVWATRKTKSSGDFFVAGKSLGMFVMAIAAFSSIQSGFGMVGGTGFTFAGGLGFTAAISIVVPLNFALAWFLVGKRLWRLGNEGEIYTLGDVAERRYGSKAARGWVAVAVVLGVIGYLGTQVLAMGAVMSVVFPVSLGVGAIIGLAILGLYTAGGGIIAGVYTDLFQGTLMASISVLVLFYAISAGGGVLDITQSLKEADPLLASPYGTFPLLSFACWFFLFGLGVAGQPHLLTKFLMVRDTRELKWGAFTAGLAYLLTTLLIVGVGLSAAALNARGEFPPVDSPDEALTTFLDNFTPSVVAGLVIAGLLAAIMSTGNSFLNLGAACLVRDIPRSLNFAVPNELLWSRIATVVLLVASTAFALYSGQLVAVLGVFGWGTFAAALVPAIVLGLVWSKATRQGAVASIVVSLVANAVLELGGYFGLQILPEGVVNGAFALAISIVTFVVVSVATHRTEPELDSRLREIIEG